MLFLDDGAALGTSFWSFRHKYFQPGPPWAPYEWTLKKRAGEAIAKRINHICIQVSKKEILSELPPKRHLVVKLDMPTRTRKMYDELKKEFATTLPSGIRIETQWAMVRAAKMHQLCQGFIYDGVGGWEDIDTTKLDWLRENIPLMLQEGPLLMWVCFQAQQQRLAHMLYDMGVPFGCIRSKHTGPERIRTKDAFQEGKFDILLLSQPVAAEGLNLQRANQAIFTCTDYRAALRENAEDRCHRIGSEVHECITYYDLVMANSLDETVQYAIKNKLSVAQEVLKHINQGV